MTALNRTAYPYFKQTPDPDELTELYTPTAAELALAKKRVHLVPNRLSFLVLLKSFQRLGYFPHPEVIPERVITHIREQLGLDASVTALAPENSRYRYHQVIRNYLQVKPYSSVAKQVATRAIEAAVGVMDHPADLINVAVETLVKESYELPAFSTLERLAKHLRAVNHTELYQQVSGQLSQEEQAYLDRLITRPEADVKAMLNRLKAPPKSEKLTHLVQLQQTFDELMSFGDAQRLLAGVNLVKRGHLAAYAKTLDITEFRDINLAKRRTLLLCLLYRAQVKMRDHLVEIDITGNSSSPASTSLSDSVFLL